MTIKWYEKSVEYAFVRKFTKLIVTPLDGNLEKFGDTIFNSENSFFLVEFKKDCSQQCVKSEREKYQDYKASANQMIQSNGHQCHFVIYGHNANKSFSLKATEYCCFIMDYICDIDIETLSNNAINYDEFKKYLSVVLEEKLRGKKSDTDAGGIISSLDNMVAISNTGEAASIYEAIQAFKLEALLDRTPPTPAPPKPRGIGR